jgi:hypothetical protein
VTSLCAVYTGRGTHSGSECVRRCQFSNYGVAAKIERDNRWTEFAPPRKVSGDNKIRRLKNLLHFNRDLQGSIGVLPVSPHDHTP